MKNMQLILIAFAFASCVFESQAVLSKLVGISNDPNDVHFYLYSNPNNYALEAGQLLDVNDLSTIQNADFIPNAPVKFITHGFIHNYTCWVPQQLKDLYFQKNVTANIIGVDWGKLALATNDPTKYVTYPFAARNIEITGKRMADLILLLNQQRNISLSQIHLIGFSLGAHVSGTAGAEIQTRLNKSIGRITGLDPAGPLFYTGIVHHLGKNDATFVDVIHTSMGLQGIAEPCGDVDFYVNDHGLAPQPGCTIVDFINCSHDYAPNVFMQTIGRTDLCACPSIPEIPKTTTVKSLLTLKPNSNSLCPCGGDNVPFGDNAKPSPGLSYDFKLNAVPISTLYSC